MNKKQETNAFVKECITIALIELMKKQQLDKISICQLVDKAGVGRASFYRNFESKKDVLKQYLTKLIQEWGKDFEERGDPDYFSESLMRHYYKYKDFYLLLYQQGLSAMVYETIRWGTKMDEAKNNMERYGKATIAGMIFGWVDEWMRQGMPETPDEIILLTANNKK
ncbi:MAG: TetR/AcrR family transcriptional regulator [Acutalibacteraceae bacterium]